MFSIKKMNVILIVFLLICILFLLGLLIYLIIVLYKSKQQTPLLLEKLTEKVSKQNQTIWLKPMVANTNA